MKQVSFLSGIHHNRMLLPFTPLWPEMIRLLETRGNKSYVNRTYKKIVRLRFASLFQLHSKAMNLRRFYRTSAALRRHEMCFHCIESSEYLRKLACSED